VLAICASGRSTVSPSAKFWSGNQTVPSEFVIDVARPALMRIAIGAGTDAGAGAGACDTAGVGVVIGAGVAAVFLAPLQPVEKNRAEMAMLARTRRFGLMQREC
jgi:hypothetical protein